jgi:Secretion system C-terminal sorting domain
MKKIPILFVLLFLATQIQAQENVLARNPIVTSGKLIRIANPFERAPGITDIPVRNERGIIMKNGQVENDEYKPSALYPEKQMSKDGALQSALDVSPLPSAASVGSNFEGIGFTSVCPADPTVAVGPNHVLQMTNGVSGAYLQVWNKTGTVLLAKTYMDAITGKGGLGDPIALYDQLADRFLISEFANKGETGSEGLVMAISKTNDPTGLWNVYFFATSQFPDYPKFSVWHDAYYCKTNEFNRPKYKGAAIYAFDKAEMIAGNPIAFVQKFALGMEDKFFSMCPVGLSGNTSAPEGTGGLFAYINDNTWSGSTTDSIGLLECRVNFTIPGRSVVASVALLPVSANTVTPPVITQPDGGQSLSAMEFRVMNQPQYRNFGASQSIVFCHMANVNGVAGVRWYELKKPAGWVVNQQSTYQPDGNHRFMSSININAAGDIGLSYNVSSTTVFPSIRFTGRRSCDPLNSMAVTEGTIIAGTVASSCFNRYGDYNHLVVDPSNNNTFWMTAMYNSGIRWSTRIGSFNLGNCGAAPVFTSGSKTITTEADKYQSNEISIFPNPAIKSVQVYFTGAMQNKTITLSILSLNGKQMYASKIKSTSKPEQISLEGIVPGQYILRAESGSTIIMKKLEVIQ